MISGTAIRIMWIGFDRITSDWELKIITSVNSSPAVVALSNLWMNFYSKYSSPLFLMTVILVKIPPRRGITTNRKMLTKSVL